DIQYSRQISIADGAGASFTYNLVNEPSGMNVSTSGLITWTPGNGVTTSGTVTAQASDGTHTAARNFTVTVNAVNDPPVLTNVPNGNAIEDIQWTYNVSRLTRIAPLLTV
ncbi:MAG: VCBS repeat-containing protein, partial [Thalassolituus oleivorans]